MAFTSVEGLLRAAAAAPLWQAVQNDDIRDRGAQGFRSYNSRRKDAVRPATGTDGTWRSPPSGAGQASSVRRWPDHGRRM